jgi:tRNA(Ile)-lysidine synthase
MSLIDKVEKRILEVKLIEPQDTIVVAVSGGPDSVALLHVLHRLSLSHKWQLIVAHVNHLFRGAESDAEAMFVEKIAGELGIRIEIANIDLPAYIAQTDLNAQVASREKRYDFFHQIAEKYQAQKIALAHHANDQAETVMMRILRGTSVFGLSGIPERRLEKKVELIRPFHRIYQSEVEAYCRKNNLNYCIDSSNGKRIYFRNQVRLDIIPYLQSFNNKLPESLNRLSDIMQQESDYVHAQTVCVYDSIVSKQKTSIHVSRLDFIALPIALQRRIIKLMIDEFLGKQEAIDFTGLELARSAITQDHKSNLKLHVHKKISLVREYDDIRLVTSTNPSLAYSYVIDRNTTEICVPEMGVVIQMQYIDVDHEISDYITDVSKKQANEAIFDAEQLIFPLHVRNRCSGDRIEPFGISGSKKIKDLFIDLKVPPSQREKLPMIMDQSDCILWIPSIRRSNHALVNPSTAQVLKMVMVPI